MVRSQRGAQADADPRVRALGFEPQEPPAWAAALGLFGVLALALLAAGLVALTLAAFQGVAPANRANRLESAVMTPPPPRLQATPRADRAAIERAARAKLEGYGWSDAAHRTARIPIDRAMQLQAEQGWPDPGGRP